MYPLGNEHSIISLYHCKAWYTFVFMLVLCTDSIVLLLLVYFLYHSITLLYMLCLLFIYFLSIMMCCFYCLVDIFLYFLNCFTCEDRKKYIHLSPKRSFSSFFFYPIQVHTQRCA